MKVSWEMSPGRTLVPVRFAASGGTSAATVSAGYVLWENPNGPSAHTTYQVTLRPV